MKRTIVFSILFASVIAFTSCGSFGEGLLAGMSGMGYGGYGGYNGGSSGGNMDYLLDPNYAMAQTMAQQNYYNQVHNSILKQSISQVNAKEEQEYQEFCRYNKKSDGSNYTKDEWRALKGQAIQNMKEGNQGYSNNSSGTNSSSSSSSRTCRKLSVSDEAHCNGTGVCPKCNGKKRYYDNSFGLDNWVDPCVVCNGSGKCPSCHGTGKR